MRKLLMFITLLTAMSVTAQDEVPRVLKWERVYGWKSKATKAYVDVKSLRHHEDATSSYNFGMIMFYRDSPIEFDVNGNTVVANVVAKYFAADCPTMKIGTVSDFYFNLDRFPVATDQPLLAYDHSDKIVDITVVEKSDPILTTLCPTYI